MKTLFKIIILPAFLLAYLPGKAQFALNGKIDGYTGKEELSVNIPLVFGFYKSNSINVPVAADGTFSIKLPVKEARFANLIFQQKFFQLLIHPGKELRISLKKADTALLLLSGTGLAVNKVVQQADIEEYPSFLNKGADYYDSYSAKDLQNKVVLPYFTKRDEKIKHVMQAAIPQDDKQKITGELTAIAYNYINDMARTESIYRQVADSLIIDVFDHSNIHKTTSGPQFYAYIDNYVRYLETKTFRKIATDNIPSKQPLPYFGISLDSANIFVNKYSKAQWRFLGAIRNLPPAVAEKYTYQLIATAVNYKELKEATDLATAFKAQFPKSLYLPAIDSKVQSLEQLLITNEHNPAIKIVPEMEKITSIYDVIKPLKGKVVYLDIWGTWCGPCKAELMYVPELKKRFKDKPVTFVYLDMDEDSKDGDWRKFIKINEMEGLHFRKSRKDIATFWKELLANANNKAEYYPQYFIFDQEGRLVITKAKRPSERDELYEQLEAVLNKAGSK